MTPNKVCYVIMPFSATTVAHSKEYWDKHFEGFLKPTIETNPNLIARRSTPLRGDILREIIKDIIISPIVVADLTDSNPNVYWELGVRQSFKHGTITIAEEGTRLPFDVNVKGTLFYRLAELPAMTLFAKNLKTALDDCDKHPENSDSHVLETVSGRGTLYEIIRREEILRRLDSLMTELVSDIRVLDGIEKMAQENLTNPNARKYPVARFKLPALELLYSSRYLEIESSFYDRIVMLYARLSDTNELLNAWHNKPERAERFILNRFREIGSLGITVRQFIEELMADLTSLQAKLSAQA